MPPKRQCAVKALVNIQKIRAVENSPPRQDVQPQREDSPPPNAPADDAGVFEVDSIADFKWDKLNGIKMFLVRWVGSRDHTWEPEASLAGCPEAVEGFWRRREAIRSRNRPRPNVNQAGSRPTVPDDDLPDI